MFQCSKCGTCCRHIADLLPDYDKGNGICVHLTKDNLCDIYNDRPFICNIDRIYDECFKDDMSRNEFYELTEEACKILQEME